MVTIAQSQMLLRTRSEAPNGLRLATEEFSEDWNFVRSANALRLGKHLIMRGWNFVSVADGSLRSGVGDTSPEAIGSALKLALRHIASRFNAIKVEPIELTQYPGFFLGRAKVVPYSIQPGAVLLMPEEAKATPALRRRRNPQIDAGLLYPHSSSATLQLKLMPISSPGSQNWPQ